MLQASCLAGLALALCGRSLPRASGCGSCWPGSLLVAAAGWGWRLTCRPGIGKRRGGSTDNNILQLTFGYNTSVSDSENSPGRWTAAHRLNGAADRQVRRGPAGRCAPGGGAGEAIRCHKTGITPAVPVRHGSQIGWLLPAS